MMLGTYCRPHMQTQEPFRQTVTQEALDRNPLRFGRLMDVQGVFPFGKSPPRPEKREDAARPGGYLSLMDDKPAAGSIRLRPHRDFDDYDLEFHTALHEKAKGTKIDFPDLYRASDGR